MKKFDFQLASILRLREARLTLEQNKLQQLCAERAKLEHRLRRIKEERTDSERWIQAMTDPSSADLRSLSAFLLGSKAQEASLQQAIQSCEEDIRSQRQKTLLAERNQKLLLNLETKQRIVWQQEFDLELELTAQDAWRSAARFRFRKV